MVLQRGKALSSDLSLLFRLVNLVLVTGMGDTVVMNAGCSSVGRVLA